MINLIFNNLTLLSTLVFTFWGLIFLLAFFVLRNIREPKISTVLAACFMVISIVTFTGIIVFSPNKNKTVEVRGLSEKLVKSDSASFSLNFSLSGNDVKVLQKNINDNKNKIIMFLTKQGFKESEIQISPITIIDNSTNNYNNNPNNPHYILSDLITVLSNNVDKVTKTSNETNVLVDQDIIFSANTSYFYKDLSSVKNKMIKESIINAKETANTFAENTGQNVSTVKSATQGLFTITSPDGTIQNDTSSVNKKIRVVTTMIYFFE